MNFMSRVAHYLQEHLLGEVTASPEVRRYFSQDASILQLAPELVVYPRNESDVRKTASFSWQLAERGRIMPITARGGGSNTSGAALGYGILLVFTAHMNKILELNPRKQLVTLEPGVTFDKLEQTLYTHGLFLPPYPAALHDATLGGGLASNVMGEKSIKYGTIGNYVRQLRVVLANGETIETGPLNKRELNRKLGLATLEGEIYRALDKLLEENHDLIEEGKKRIKAQRNTAGYNLFGIKKGHSFDLTPLFVGSQGTLGIITEATLSLAAYNPLTQLALVSLEELGQLSEVLPKLLELKPSVFDMMNHAAVEQISRLNPSQLAGALIHPNAAVHLFLEFDDSKEGAQKKALKQLQKIVNSVGGVYQVGQTLEEQEKIWKVRHSVSTILSHSPGPAKSLPIVEDVSLPTEQLVDFLSQSAQIYAQNGLAAAAWGQAGDGVISIQPVLDLAQTGDRQKLFKITDSLYSLAIQMGGSTSGSSGDGRIRAPYNELLYGEELHNLMLQVKKIFDPHGTLNPGVKTASPQDIKNLLRSEYSLTHHNHLPRS